MKNWAQGAGVNGIGSIHLLRAGMDMRSVYIHVSATEQQLDQCPSLLSGWYLAHRPTMCELSMGHGDRTPAAWYKTGAAEGERSPGKPTRAKSTPAVVPGTALALAKARVGGY